MAALSKTELDRVTKEWREDLVRRGLADDAPAAPAVKSGNSNHALIAAIMKGIAPVIDQFVKSEVEKSVAPLRAQIELLTKALVVRPPTDQHDRGHGNDASRGPTLSDWTQ